MYTIEPNKIRIYLIDKTGIIRIYKDYYTFLNNVTYHFIDRYVVNNYHALKSEYHWLFNNNSPAVDYYLVKDERGEVYSRESLLDDIRELHIKRHYKNFPKYIHRYDPVPRTGKGSYRGYFRHPKTIQEKRWNVAHEDYVRGKRKKHNLPDPRDDIIRQDHYTRKSWKHYKKKKQWM